MKIYEGKGGAYVTFEKTGARGLYVVKLHTGAGEVADKMLCDDYRLACEYRKAFLKIARSNR